MHPMMAGKLVSEILQQIVTQATIGSRLIDLDAFAEKMVRDSGATPASEHLLFEIKMEPPEAYPLNSEICVAR